MEDDQFGSESESEDNDETMSRGQPYEDFLETPPKMSMVKGGGPGQQNQYYEESIAAVAAITANTNANYLSENLTADLMNVAVPHEFIKNSD